MTASGKKLEKAEVSLRLFFTQERRKVFVTRIGERFGDSEALRSREEIT